MTTQIKVFGGKGESTSTCEAEMNEWLAQQGEDFQLMTCVPLALQPGVMFTLIYQTKKVKKKA